MGNFYPRFVYKKCRFLPFTTGRWHGYEAVFFPLPPYTVSPFSHACQDRATSFLLLHTTPRDPRFFPLLSQPNSDLIFFSGDLRRGWAYSLPVPFPLFCHPRLVMRNRAPFPCSTSDLCRKSCDILSPFFLHHPGVRELQS